MTRPVTPRQIEVILAELGEAMSRDKRNPELDSWGLRIREATHWEKAARELRAASEPDA